MAIEALRDLSKDDILGALGLASRPSPMGQFLGALAWFGAGLALGAGVALVLAPTSGGQLREDMTARLRNARTRVPHTVNNVHDMSDTSVREDSNSLAT